MQKDKKDNASHSEIEEESGMADLTSTFFLYRPVDDGVKILRCRSLDTVVEIPDEIDEMPVVELGAYVCSAHVRQMEEGIWTGPEEEWLEIPEVSGERVTEVILPDGLLKVGAYAFYNCWNLAKLTFSSRTLDWGAGAFTGCVGVRELDVHVAEGEKSCLKEVLTELRQTLFVDYHGRQEAKLVFPEFFEESVENTPARILETHMHGCGHQYRYCFLQSEFQFRGYDSLFPNVQVQEAEELVIRLALGRLRFPYGLTKEYRSAYREYLEAHRIGAAAGAVSRDDMEELRWVMEQCSFEKPEMDEVIAAAGKAGNAVMMSYLMDWQHSRFSGSVCGEGGGEKRKKRRFEL